MTGPDPLSNLLTPPPVPPHSSRPFILVPLYIYPTPGAWAPLYAAATAHPSLDFYVVVNPSNGPGDGALPDVNYAVALGRLTALPNVRVVGYVHCSYGRRAAEGIVADVERYRGWEGESIRAGIETIIIDGIFIDETPSSTEYVQYLAELANAAKTILNRNILVPIPANVIFDGAAQPDAASEADDGDGEAVDGREADDREDEDEKEEKGAVIVEAAAETQTQTEAHAQEARDQDAPPSTPPQLPSGAITPSTSSAIVIYNPGVVVDPIFYQAADYVVAFENAAAQWGAAAAAADANNPSVEQSLRRLPQSLRQRSVPVVHSASGGFAAIAALTRRAVDEVGCLGLFVTSCPGYTAWCGSWDAFVAEVARRTTTAR